MQDPDEEGAMTHRKKKVKNISVQKGHRLLCPTVLVTMNKPRPHQMKMLFGMKNSELWVALTPDNVKFVVDGISESVASKQYGRTKKRKREDNSDSPQETLTSSQGANQELSSPGLDQEALDQY